MLFRERGGIPWESYTVMHLDQAVCTIRNDGICEIIAPEFMPYHLVLEADDSLESRINNLQNFYYWCASRTLSLDRRYAKEILNSIGAPQATTDRDRATIALTYHAVTLTDVFWVRASDDDCHYEEISLFDHSLSDAFVDVSLRGRTLTAENAELIADRDIAGDISTSGIAPKAWVRENGTFYLLKNGSAADVAAELLASRIIRCFDVRQVRYEQAEYKGVPVSKSRIMTSVEYGIVPMEFVEIYAANHDTTRDEMIRRVDRFGFCMMNIVDYLVGNTDRHWGNWGFMIDNRTNRPIYLFPLMDFNRAFRAYDTLEGSRCLTTAEPMNQMEAALAAVQECGLNQREEVEASWFADAAQWEMFSRRLELLRDAERC